MKLPKDTKPMLWGAVVGAGLCMLLGFTWGGWVTGGTARKDVAAAAHDATVVALAPLCADRFRAQGDVAAKMAEITKASSWERGSIIEKSGFATKPGNTSGDPSIAQACVALLMAPATPKT
jgi:hypothetical protein